MDIKKYLEISQIELNQLEISLIKFFISLTQLLL